MRMTPLFVCIYSFLLCGVSESVPNRRYASGKFPLAVSEKSLCLIFYYRTVMGNFPLHVYTSSMFAILVNLSRIIYAYE